MADPAGAPWRDVPPCYGPWQTVYGLFRRWQRNGTWRKILTALQARADAAGLITWDVSVDSTVARAHQHAAGARRRGDLQAEPPGGVADEPADHRLGRSRGGLTTKVHLACEQRQKPLSVVITAGQRGDSPQFQAVLGQIRVPRPGGGRPRTRPDRVLADKAYGSRANRAYLRKRGIRCTIPEKANQVRHRKAKGRHGGRPPAFDPEDYKARHAVENIFRDSKLGAALRHLPYVGISPGEPRLDVGGAARRQHGRLAAPAHRRHRRGGHPGRARRARRQGHDRHLAVAADRRPGTADPPRPPPDAAAPARPLPASRGPHPATATASTGLTCTLSPGSPSLPTACQPRPGERPANREPGAGSRVVSMPATRNPAPSSQYEAAGSGDRP